MGIASMVIGIVSAIFSFIPCVNIYALIPSIVGLVLGIVDVVLKKKNNVGGIGMGVAGIVLNGIAVILAIILYASFYAAVSAISDSLYDFF